MMASKGWSVAGTWIQDTGGEQVGAIEYRTIDQSEIQIHYIFDRYLLLRSRIRFEVTYKSYSG